MCGNSKFSASSIEIYVRCTLALHTHISISMARRQNENTLSIKKITGVDKSKKNLINVSKFQIVCSQSERKHTGRQENYSHFPEI